MRFRLGNDRSIQVRSRDAQWLVPLLAVIGLAGWILWHTFEVETTQRGKIYLEISEQHKQQMQSILQSNQQLRSLLEQQQALLYMLAQTVPPEKRPPIPFPDLLRRWTMPMPERRQDEEGIR